MRISDWSSDVCSSDLRARAGPRGRGGGLFRRGKADREGKVMTYSRRHPELVSGSIAPRAMSSIVENRSEEHTSELQSLMRISYAVFCLKKKTTTIQMEQHHTLKERQTKMS